MFKCPNDLMRISFFPVAVTKPDLILLPLWDCEEWAISDMIYIYLQVFACMALLLPPSLLALVGLPKQTSPSK